MDMDWHSSYMRQHYRYQGFGSSMQLLEFAGVGLTAGKAEAMHDAAGTCMFWCNNGNQSSTVLLLSGLMFRI